MNNLLAKYQSFLKSPREKRSVFKSAKGQSLTGDPANGRVGTAKPEGLSLLEKPLSPSTIQNYLSDTRHFLKWLSKSIQEPEIQPRHITPTVVKTYASELKKSCSSELKEFTSFATINRRLSSLRRFGYFLVSTGLIDNNPTANLSNLNSTPRSTTIGRIIKHYQNYLKDEELSNSTINNYLSDLKSYLLWAQKQPHLLDSQKNQRQT